MSNVTLDIIQLRSIISEAVANGIAEYERQKSGVDYKNLPEHLTKTQTAKLLNVSVKTIERKLESGDLTKKTIGSSVRVTKKSVLKLLNIRF